MRRRGRRRRAWLLPALLLCCLLLLAGGVVATRLLYPLRYEQYVEQYSAEYKLPPALVYGVIRTESRFRPQAVSSIGARGLMQITEQTFDWAKWRMGDEVTEYDALFDPETNIRYGCFILSLLLQEFENPEAALAAYHAGWGSVKKWLGDAQHSADGVTLDSIPFANTARYVPDVCRAMGVYARLYGK